MKSHTATSEEREWMDAITQLGCIVCRLEFGVSSPSEVHHLEGKVKAGGHLLTIPLCYNHHRGGMATPMCVSRHPYKAQFEARYGTEKYLHDETKKLIHKRPDTGRLGPSLEAETLLK